VQLTAPILLVHIILCSYPLEHLKVHILSAISSLLTQPSATVIVVPCTATWRAGGSYLCVLCSLTSRRHHDKVVPGMDTSSTILIQKLHSMHSSVVIQVSGTRVYNYYVFNIFR
jgi:hypothetical protein